MSTPTATRAQEHQTRWQTIAGDPDLRDLPYKVETNARGQIVLSPHKNRHSVRQEEVQEQLRIHAPEGRQPTELAIATPQGVKVADVVWMSPGRWEEMQQTGDPTTLAPEICVEVMSGSNDWAEINEKRRLYRGASAEEVWVVDEEGEVHFFAGEEKGVSEIAPGFPDQI